MRLAEILACAAKIDSITASPYISSISHQNSIGNFTGQITMDSPVECPSSSSQATGNQIQTVHCKKYRKSTVTYMAPVMLDGLKHFFPTYDCVFWNHHVCTNRVIMFPGIFAANAFKCDTFKVWSGK